MNKLSFKKNKVLLGKALWGNSHGLKAFLLCAVLMIILSLSVFNSQADTSFVINKSSVLVNTTYKEGVTVSAGYPVITDRDGIVKFSSNTVFPQWASPNGSVSFLTTANNLQIGNYTYTIRVSDRANNSREDSKNFTILFKLAGCGDKIINLSSGEECDDGNLVNGDGCTSLCKIETCGNGKVDPDEECDGSNLNGFTCPFGGTISCYKNCTYDTHLCGSPPNFCGDGRIQPGEQCDGSSQSIACSALNPTYTGGTARCMTGKCIYDTSGCTGGATKGACGDSIIERPNNLGLNEQCDGSTYGKGCSDINPVFIGGSLTCTDCLYNTTQCDAGDGGYCSDGAKNQLSEECDKTDLGSATCKSLGYASGTLKCAATGCKLDKSACVPGTGSEPYCGDSAVQQPNNAGFNEQCDNTDLNSKTCSNFPPYTDGTLSCKGDCTFDYASCTGNSPKCGDGVRNLLSENCDGSDLLGKTCQSLGYTSGILKCYAAGTINECQLDKSGCVKSNGTSKFCGDSIIQLPNDAGVNEQCDESNLNSKQCTDVGNFVGGTLACRGDCSFDTTKCHKDTVYCGNGQLDPCEQCDGSIGTMTCAGFGFNGGYLSCKNCMYNTSACVGNSGGYCGNGGVEKGEQCDNGLGALQCSKINSVFTGGSLNCNMTNEKCAVDTCQCASIPPDPVCGDAVKNLPTEDCDGADLGGKTCVALGYASGTLKCYSVSSANQCLFDKSGCVPAIISAKECGDGNIDSPNNAGVIEQCDGKNLNSKKCTDFDGYAAGNLACSGDCTYDYSGCTKTNLRCGDGVRNLANEDCDGVDLGGESCVALGYASGSLKCTAAGTASQCLFDKSGCVPGSNNYCGDANIQQPNSAGFNEACDSANLNNKQCANFDTYAAGTLSCSGSCSFEYSKCTNGTFRCGDGVKNQLSEDCDTTDFAGHNCKTLGYASGSLKCTSNCKFDKSLCIPAASARVCGDSKVDTPNDGGINEDCDKMNLSGKQCSDFGEYTGGTLICHGDCSFDYTKCISEKTVCGDGVVQHPNNDGLVEDCDLNDLHGESCKSLGYASGTLKCSSSCSYDKSGCIASNGTSEFCGDAFIQKPNDANLNESCDGSNLNNKQCSDADDYKNGTLKCNGDCSFSYLGCRKPADVSQGVCNDGILNSANEVCDKLDLGLMKKCSDFASFIDGALKCGSDCHFNTSACIAGNTSQNLTCSDKKKDGIESDVDCGGSCLCCAAAKKCIVNNDCCSGFCSSGVCAEPRCDDGVLNGLETDVDCGGSCPKCNENQSCNVKDDCSSDFCNLNNKCSTPNCFDGEKNGLETDTDCGGDCAAKCKVGSVCLSGVDCDTEFCDAGVCSCDQTKDSDGDGMPDCWELKWGLDPNDPSDAKKDQDGDGKTNLEEFKLGTDPTDANDPPETKSHTLPIIMLILGLLLMGASTAFLIYSRKVLLPEQRKASAARNSAQSQLSRQQGQQGQSSFNKLSGMPGQSAGSSAKNMSLAQILARRKAGQADAAEKPAQSSAQPTAKEVSSDDKKSQSAQSGSKKQDKDDFIPLSELGKKSQQDSQGSSKSGSAADSADDKKEAKPLSLGASFEKLKSLIKNNGGADSSDSVGKEQPDSKDVKKALKELSDSVKVKDKDVDKDKNKEDAGEEKGTKKDKDKSTDGKAKK